MVEPLRDKQKRLARETILRAAADEIVESGLEDLSLLDIARRAGVSKRTLYNYFDSRETLFSDLGEWSDELTLEMGGFIRPEGLDRLPEMIPAIWRTWAAQGSIHQATLMIDAASSESGISPGRQARREAMRQAIEKVQPALDHDRANELAAVLHALASAPIYQRLTTQDGLSIETAGELIGWIVTLIHDALEAGANPFQTNQKGDPS